MPRKTKNPPPPKERPEPAPVVGTKGPVPFDPGPLPKSCVDENGRALPMTDEERRAYVVRVKALRRHLESMGTPEEHEEDYDELMKALAETRRAEGRVF